MAGDSFVSFVRWNQRPELAGAAPLAAGRKAPNNPWGEGATTLEWTLSSPPPFHQYSTLPVIE